MSDDSEYHHLEPLLRDHSALAEGDPRKARLREELVAGFLPVAQHVARRFAGRGEPLGDLEQVASIGLLHALDRFDPEIGREFLSYAVPTIMGEVRRHFRDTTWSVRTPRAIKDTYLRVGSATSSLSQRLNRAPTVAEIATELDIDRDQVAEAISAYSAHRSDSLDTLLDESTEQAPVIAAQLGAADPEFARAEAGLLVADLVGRLPVREQRMLVLRFVHEQTQAEIAAELAISQMHVSRLLSRTLTQLREEIRRQDAELLGPAVGA